LVEQVLEEAKVKKSQVDAIILTGSPVHRGKIQPFLETYFDGRKFYNSVNPDEAVVRGAAIQAQVLSLPSSDEEVYDVVVTALGLGIETSEGTFTQLICRHSIILKARIVSRVFSTLTDNQSKVVLRIFQVSDYWLARTDCSASSSL
jgi:molecular chaperone DnaK (HSP70)